MSVTSGESLRDTEVKSPPRTHKAETALGGNPSQSCYLLLPSALSGQVLARGSVSAAWWRRETCLLYLPGRKISCAASQDSQPALSFVGVTGEGLPGWSPGPGHGQQCRWPQETIAS